MAEVYTKQNITKYNDFFCRAVFAAPKSIQATVTILENLHVILEKTPQDDIRSEILPLLFNAFESSTIQVQVNKINFKTQPLIWQLLVIFKLIRFLFLCVFVCVYSVLLMPIGSGISCCDKCLRMAGWSVDKKNGFTKNQDSLWKKSQRSKDCCERFVMYRTNIG